MNKDHIIAEIQRTAKENSGKPLGMSKFAEATGISRNDWFGKHWTKWGDALIEAGYKPNTLQGAYSEEYVMEKLISLIRELGKYPTAGEIRMKARADSDFPSHSVFTNRGPKAVLVKKLTAFCGGKPQYADVLAICSETEINTDTPDSGGQTAEADGFVYLMKSGRYYKIGRTSSVGRREYELSIKMPDELKTVHIIKTDDPVGIEKYWHERFADKRKKGEWFELKPQDIKAFKRRKFM